MQFAALLLVPLTPTTVIAAKDERRADCHVPEITPELITIDLLSQLNAHPYQAEATRSPMTSDLHPPVELEHITTEHRTESPDRTPFQFAQLPNSGASPLVTIDLLSRLGEPSCGNPSIVVEANEQTYATPPASGVDGQQQPSATTSASLPPAYDHPIGCPDNYEWRGSYCLRHRPKVGTGWYMSCKRHKTERDFRDDPSSSTTRSAAAAASSRSRAAPRNSRFRFGGSHLVSRQVFGECPEEQVCFQLHGVHRGLGLPNTRWSPYLRPQRPMPRIACVPRVYSPTNPNVPAIAPLTVSWPPDFVAGAVDVAIAHNHVNVLDLGSSVPHTTP